MNIILMSDCKQSHSVYKKLIKPPYNHKVISIVEEDADHWGILKNWGGSDTLECVSVGKAVKQYRERKADIFVIPSLSEPINRGMHRLLKDLNVQENDIMYAPVEMTLDDAEDCQFLDKPLGLFKERRELETMEFHVADHCNLNCAHCSMFAGLVTQKQFPDFEEYKRDVLQLKKYFDHVKRIRIIGGEPLLNPELGKYLIFSRKVFPYSFIKVITNGILVPQMSQELIDIIKENKIHITVTYYPVLNDKIDDIKNFLDSQNIVNDISPLVTKFQKIYDFDGNGNIDYNFMTCYWKSGCATMKNGKFAACFVPFVFPFAAAAFSFNYEESGLIDLYDKDMTTVSFREKLETPFSICKYCARRGILEKWRLIKDKNDLNICEWCL